MCGWTVAESHAKEFETGGPPFSGTLKIRSEGYTVPLERSFSRGGRSRFFPS